MSGLSDRRRGVERMASPFGRGASLSDEGSREFLAGTCPKMGILHNRALKIVSALDFHDLPRPLGVSGVRVGA